MTGDRPQRPSLFMRAFTKLHEKLSKELDQEDAEVIAKKAVFEKQPSTYWQFLQLIPWTQPWLLTVMGFHLVTFIIILFTRKYQTVQGVIFLILLSGVYFSEMINAWAAEHWKIFSDQQYFDSNGLFISTIWSTPILLNCLVLVVSWLYSISQTLIDLKKKQIIAEYERSKAKSKTDKQGEKRESKKKQ